jgi:TM2 domain-containing membrane protein YozV
VPSDEPQDTDDESPEAAEEPSEESLEPSEESPAADEEPSEESLEADEEPPAAEEPSEESPEDEESVGESVTIGADPARDVFSAVESGPDETGDAESEDDATETGADEATEAEPETDEATEAEPEAEASGMVFCRQCGERISESAPTCPNCGAPQDAGSGGRKEKDPGIAALASLIVPGAGQLYNGQFVRGAVAFVGVGLADLLLVVVALVLSIILIGPLFLLLIPVVHILVAYDAYDQAKRINSGEIDPDA